MVYPNAATNTFTAGTDAKAAEVNANFTNLLNGASALGVPASIGMVPVGSIVSWHKTSYEKSSTGSQTNTTQSATQLIDSTADFVTDGITAGMIVHNEADNEFAIVETVVDLNTLTLVSDLNADTANVDTFNGATGKAYAIYATPELPDNWLECNGQVISDVASPINGMTLPSLHTAVEDVNGYFLRGVIEGAATGTTEGSQVLSHDHDIRVANSAASGDTVVRGSADDHLSTTAINTFGGSESRPVAFAIIWIMRIK